MTQEFDSAALSALSRVFGIAEPGEQQAFLDDGNISQVLDIISLSRRALTPFTTGIFYGVLQNVHAVGEELQSFVNPYAPVNVHNGYPLVIPDQFDIWLLGAVAKANVATAVVDWGVVGIDYAASSVGVSDTAAGGAPSLVNRELGLAAWTDFATIDAINGGYGIDASGRSFVPLRQRLPRDAVVTFRSQTNMASARTTTCYLTLGIFPAGLGQDLMG